MLTVVTQIADYYGGARFTATRWRVPDPVKRSRRWHRRLAPRRGLLWDRRAHIDAINDLSFLVSLLRPKPSSCRLGAGIRVLLIASRPFASPLSSVLPHRKT